MKLKQVNLDQTGVAIYTLKNNEEKQVPLYSLKPVEEAHELLIYFEGAEIKAVYITNNLMETKIEDTIEEYRKSYSELPENYMEELVSGFPYIIGNGINSFSMYYA